MNNREHKKLHRLRLDMNRRLDRLCTGLEWIAYFIYLFFVAWDFIVVNYLHGIIKQGSEGIGFLQLIGMIFAIGLMFLSKWAR